MKNLRLTRVVVVVIIITFLMTFMRTPGSVTATQNNTEENRDQINLPDRYDLRELDRLTSVKAQGGIGSCWALTSIAALESTLKTTENIEYDFSESNMINQTSDIYATGFDRQPSYGGDDLIATAYYASWRGPVLESDDPYPLSGKKEDLELTTGCKVVKHVQEVIFLPDRKNPLDNNLIKEHVMKYGAISVAMWKGTKSTYGRYYNEEEFAWYYPDKKVNNEGNGHAVNIVGWDDNYPKENFNITPPRDGAFIVRNTKGSKWGHPEGQKNMDGYFYISYYDGMLFDKRDSLVGNGVITRVDDIDNYDHIYQHDPLGFSKELQVYGQEAWFANIFTIDGMGEEDLQAVSFYTMQSNLDYEIWIRNDYKNENDLNKMAKVKTGQIDLPGYHTIDLNRRYPVKGKQIAIAVKLISKTEKPTIAIESPTGLSTSKAKSGKGESYIKRGSTWYDLTIKDIGANVCLKAFTKERQNKALIPVDQMKKDVDFTVKWIKNHQPIARTEGYTEKQEQTIEKVYKAIQNPLSKSDFFLTINQLFTMMRDGHTHLRYSFEDERLIDMPFTWLEEGIVINATNTYFQLGDKVKKIGSKTSVELNKMLYEQLSSENDYWIRYQATKHLIRETYLRYFDLVGDDDTVSVELERDGIVSVVRVPLGRNLNGSSYEGNKWYSWHIEKANNLGYFRFDKFVSGDRFEQIKIEMDAFFAKVAEDNIDHVVFDLRENKGGTAQILNYMLSFFPLEIVYGAGYQVYDVRSPIKKEPLLFTGDVYVMISNKTYSCSVYATTILKDNGIVKVIGEPSGENPAFNRHGSGSDGKLPESGWPFMMTSHKGSRPMDHDTSEIAIFPDIPVYTTRQDLIANRDIQMEIMRQISHGQYDYAEEHITVGIEDKILNLDSLPSKIHEQIVKKVWLEDTINRKHIDCKIEYSKDGATITLPTHLDKSSYYLVFDRIGKDYAVLISRQKKQMIDHGIKGMSYSEKFNYLITSFGVGIVKSVEKSKTYFENEQDKRYAIREASFPSANKETLIMSPYQVLASGNYTVMFMEGSITYTDGSKNIDDIELAFVVD